MATPWSHKNLVVWQKSIALAGKVYAATRRLPSEERLELGGQLRRAVLSVASNIAAGSARRSRSEFLQCLYLARGSLAEVETQIMIAVDQAFIDERDALLDEINAVGRLLTGLIHSLVSADKTAHARACAHQSQSADRMPPVP